MSFWTVLFIALTTLWAIGLTAGVLALWSEVDPLNKGSGNRRKSYRNPPSRKRRSGTAKLKRRLKEVEEKNRKLRKDLGRLAEQVNAMTRQTNEGHATSRRAPRPEPTETRRAAGSSPSSKEDIVRSYNKVVEKELDQRKFEKTYSPSRIGVSNARERFEKADAEPRIEEMSKGKYWLIALGSKHFVVPRPSGVIKEGDRREGAFHRLFECGQLSRKKQYTVQQLQRPAIVQSAGDGSWRVKKKGQLRLREYS